MFITTDSEFENQDENSGLDDSENQSDVYSMDSEDDCEESKNESTLEYNLSALESNDSENSFSDDEMAVSGKCIREYLLHFISLFLKFTIIVVLV